MLSSLYFFEKLFVFKVYLIEISDIKAPLAGTIPQQQRLYFAVRYQ